MKKVYSEPDIFFESFTLNTNIAAGCEIQVNTQTDRCGAIKGHSIIFNTSVADNCRSIIIDGDNQHDNVCYHNPKDEMNLFFS